MLYSLSMHVSTIMVLKPVSHLSLPIYNMSLQYAGFAVCVFVLIQYLVQAKEHLSKDEGLNVSFDRENIAFSLFCVDFQMKTAIF
jgi:hypothetical protein